MEYASMLESMKNKDLDNFECYGEKIQIPKFYNDKNFFINGFRAGYYRAKPDEISDEEILEAAAKHFNKEELVEGVCIKYVLQCAFIDGTKWYREQLKKENEV
jgi:hypothetical protein